MLKSESVADIPGTPPVTNACPLADKVGVIVQASGNSSFILSSLSALGAVRFFSFVLGGRPKGFVSFPGFLSIRVFPYVSGGRYCSVLLSS